MIKRALSVACFGIASVFLLGCQATGMNDHDGGEVEGVNTLQVLSAHFGDALTFSLEGEGSVLTYCAANTCKELSTRNRHGKAALSDFLYLLFIYGHVSNMPDAKRFKDARPAEEVERVLGRNDANCKGGAGYARCVMEDIYEKADITAHFVRYDEGVKVKEELDVWKMLEK